MQSTTSQSLYDAASAYIGTMEHPGPDQHNPLIVEMFAASGHQWVDDDETPWCAAFVGYILAQAGLIGTGSLRALSYANYGDPVSLSKAELGDLVCWPRGDDGSGHVGFYAGSPAPGLISVLGGNQANSVNVTDYSIHPGLVVRRAALKAAGSQPTKLTLASGSRGELVGVVQRRLSGLLYPVGAQDGIFGPATEAAVMAFQRANDLPVTGQVNDDFWQALDHATINPLAANRQSVTADDLAEQGDKRVLTSRSRRKWSGSAGVLGAILAAITTLQGALAQLGQVGAIVSEVLEQIGPVSPLVWLGLTGFAGFLWYTEFIDERQAVDDTKKAKYVG